jgi:hypothetical protein
MFFQKLFPRTEIRKSFHCKRPNFTYVKEKETQLLSLKYCDDGVQRDRLCGLVVGLPGYRSRGPGSIPCATRISEK